MRTFRVLQTGKQFLGLEDPQNGWSKRKRPPRKKRPGPQARGSLKRHHHDGALSSSEDSNEEVVTVADRRHPLFGRSFRVAHRPTAVGARGKRVIFVFYRDNIQLQLPIISITDRPIFSPITKLNWEGAEELRARALALGVLPCIQNKSGETCRKTSGGKSSPNSSTRSEG